MTDRGQLIKTGYLLKTSQFWTLEPFPILFFGKLLDRFFDWSSQLFTSLDRFDLEENSIGYHPRFFIYKNFIRL